MKKKNLVYLVNILIIFFTANNNLFSQTSNIRESALKIFFDCEDCDEEYIKKELTYVNYVRDSKEAHVHILVTEESSGNGGDKYSFFFIGQMEFKGQNDTLSFFTNSDATNDEIRQKQLHTLQIGLMRYVAKTPIASNISITYKSAEKENEVVKDKWNSWVFDLNLSGYFNGEKLYKYTSLNSSIDISRVTPELKVETDLSFNYNKEVYDVDDSLIVVTRNSKYFEHLFVKSINDHWSIGYITEMRASFYSNYNFHTIIAPAIEFNIFPYSESSRKQIRFLYHIGGLYSNYIDTTIYNKTKELLFAQKIEIATEFKEKWGSVSLNFYGSNYFHNLDFNNFGFDASVSLRIAKGLSLRFYGGLSLVHDQLNLRKGDINKDDMLTRRRELASQYNYWGSIGLTYTFGSIYNNVVNPRFGN
jgi:hypothetical protein